MNKVYKIVLLFICMVSFLAFNTLPSAAETKVGYVDVLKAVNESNQGKDAKKVWQDLRANKLDEVKRKRDEMDSLKDELFKQGSVLSESSRQEKELKLERLERDYKRMVDDSSLELNRKEMELTQEILKDIRQIVIDMGKKDNYTIIITDPSSDKSGQGGLLLYIDNAIDLTDEVIRTYNGRK
ncbi:MAG TPA: OmpH family outer membrane protein [Thermodesulfovibrionia bacterium]|nr:OmpH family outer membrane protein [Thermodesulfovibrionia bacterium]